MAIASGLPCVDYLSSRFHLEDQVRYSPEFFTDFNYSEYLPRFFTIHNEVKKDHKNYQRSTHQHIDYEPILDFSQLNISQGFNFSIYDKSTITKCENFNTTLITDTPQDVSVRNVDLINEKVCEKDKHVESRTCLSRNGESTKLCTKFIRQEDTISEIDLEVGEILKDSPQLFINKKLSNVYDEIPFIEIDSSDSECELIQIANRSSRNKHLSRKRSSAEFLKTCCENDYSVDGNTKRPCINADKMYSSIKPGFQKSIYEREVFVPIATACVTTLAGT